MSTEHGEKTAALFSGQGVQSEGMGKDVYDRYGIARDVYKDSSEVIGVNVAEVCFGSLAYLLDQSPEIAQAAIATTSLAEYRAWVDENQRLPDVVTGLSMGLYTALSPARVISCGRQESDQKTINLIHERARIIQDLAANGDGEGGMGVILGQLRDDVLSRISPELRVAVARVGHQLVSGPKEVVATHIHEWSERIGDRKARILPIHVAAHHPWQEDAIPPLTPLLERDIKHAPCIDLLSNDPEYGYLLTPDSIIKHLLSQMTKEARYDWTAQQLINDGVTEVVEFGDPKRGLTKDVSKTGSVQVVKFPASLQTA